MAPQPSRGNSSRRLRSVVQLCLRPVWGRRTGRLQLVWCAVQVETQPLVSMDFVNDPHSSIVDALSTMVVDGKMVKIYAWYDNEWGYSCRMAEIGKMVIESL